MRIVLRIENVFVIILAWIIYKAHDNTHGVFMTVKEMGKAIKGRREFLKVSQVDLAEITGVSRRSLQAIEGGEGNPTIAQIDKILSALGMEIKIGIKING